jgi:putative GTP pyrophosphokinase
MAKQKARQKAKYDIAQWEKEYNSLRPLLIQLDQEIDHQLGQLLHRSVALAFPVQHRVKSWSSIAEKLQRVRLSLTGLQDLQDLVGFRIVLQFRRDVERVCSVIERTFKIVDRYDTVKRLKEDQFGYSSVHYVVELPAEWLAVPTMAGLAKLRAEIQVRTTPQHIWAEASQTLQYKNERAVPQALKRAIYRVSALLETVDLEFERVLSDRDSYKAEVAQTTPAEEALNVETLQQVLDSEWPSANKDAEGEDYADLLTDLNALGVTTPGALRKLISKWRNSVLAKDAGRVASERKHPDALTRQERVNAGVFFTHVGLTRSALEMELPQRYDEYFTRKWKLPQRSR